MPPFLSADWVAAFNAALAGVRVDPPGDDAGLAAQDGRFTVGQIVTGGPDGDHHLLLEVADGAVTMSAVDAAAGDAAAVTVRLSWDDAAALAAGRLSPAAALAEGRIRVRGDLAVLAAGQAALAAAQPHLAALSAATTF